MAIVEIPLISRTQIETVTLDGVDYKIQNRWNKYGYWVMDIFNIDDTKLISGMVIVPGSDLLGQFGYLPIGESAMMIVVVTPGALPSSDVPTLEGLGTQTKLYYVTPPFPGV